MLIWVVYAILNFVCMVVCYITNPIVCLFCNEEGELPSIFRMWQTWDDSCNPRFYVLEHAPKFLRYDYDKHYEEYKGTTPDLEAVGQTRWFAKVKDGNFTTKEKIQRYCCRVLWLTRNCGYGFAFWCFGRTVDMKDITIKDIGDREKFLYDEHENILTRVWSYKNSNLITDKIELNVYMGWKVNEGDIGPKQCMVATRPIAIRFN